MSLLLLWDVLTLIPTHSIFKTEACSQVFNHLWHPEATDVTEASALKAFNIRERWRCLTALLVDAIVACHNPLHRHAHQVHWICLFFFFCLVRADKSVKKNQTFPLCPFSCHVTSDNSKQYWCQPILVRKGSSTSTVWFLHLCHPTAECDSCATLPVTFQFYYNSLKNVCKTTYCAGSPCPQGLLRLTNIESTQRAQNSKELQTLKRSRTGSQCKLIINNVNIKSVNQSFVVAFIFQHSLEEFYTKLLFSQAKPVMLRHYKGHQKTTIMGI